MFERVALEKAGGEGSVCAFAGKEQIIKRKQAQRKIEPDRIRPPGRVAIIVSGKVAINAPVASVPRGSPGMPQITATTGMAASAGVGGEKRMSRPH